MAKLTKEFVENEIHLTTSGQRFYRDDDVPGFAIRVSRDYLLFLLLTGLRCGEARQLKWTYIDFRNKLLTIPRAQTKPDREHQLPLTDFVVALLKKRYAYRNHSEWIFQSCRLRNKHLSPSNLGSKYFGCAKALVSAQLGGAISQPADPERRNVSQPGYIPLAP